MAKHHHYQTKIEWTGNLGSGTLDYRAYKRDYTICAEGKENIILGSSDSNFMGDKTRYNPEELFLASLSACHMLWFLHLCSAHHIVVLEYVDQATGIMEESTDKSGRFTEVVLHPIISITNKGQEDLAISLHKKANQMCFIANSCNFVINHQVTIKYV